VVEPVAPTHSIIRDVRVEAHFDPNDGTLLMACVLERKPFDDRWEFCEIVAASEYFDETLARVRIAYLVDALLTNPF
jgi:hypothetical protein